MTGWENKSGMTQKVEIQNNKKDGAATKKGGSGQDQKNEFSMSVVSIESKESTPEEDSDKKAEEMNLGDLGARQSARARNRR